jgi:hypothetical protein
MRRGRGLALAALVAVALLVLVAIGRWERSNRADEQNRKMRAIVAEIGPLDSSSLSAFRYLPASNFDCLLYRRGRNPFALELCADRDGRVIETIDRRGDDPEIASLRDDRFRSTVRVDRDEVNRLLARMIQPAR